MKSILTDMANSNVFLGMAKNSDSPRDPKSFMYGFADV